LVKGFGRGGGLACPSGDQEGRLVDEDSDEPALEGTFALKLWAIARGRAMTVPDCLFGCINGGEDATCDEIKHFATARKLLIETVFASITIRAGVGANIRNADLLAGFRSGGNWNTGSVSHEHEFLSLLL
jgi:hypothetical protein